ncbi:MAG: hypothetical protein ACT4TC_11505 [Myxococcaceae bacterium]
MKVDQAREQAEKRASEESVQRTMMSATLDALRRKPLPIIKPVTASTSRLPSTLNVQGLKKTESLQRARSQMHTEAKRLIHVRAEGMGHAKERREERLIERVTQELQKEKVPEPQQPNHPPIPFELSGSTKSSEPTPSQLASSVALVERIEQLIRSGRPALSFSLGGSFNADVEVERTGRNEVTLQIRGKRGPPPPQDLSRLRDELQSRGLTLKSLNVS